MSSCNFTYDLATTPESNETLIGKTVIRVLDCSNNISANELCGLWNFNRCPSDKDYCQPYVVGDMIYKQFFNPRKYYSYSFIHVIDAATGTDAVVYSTPYSIEQGYDKNDNLFTNLFIDTNKLPNTNCFYFKIVGFKCRFKEPEEIEAFAQCVKDLKDLGYSTAEAKEICLTDTCAESMDVIYSEPYCKVTCQNTILVEGFYPNYDCNGNFYGTFTSGSATNSFKPQLRLMGSVEPNQYDIEETLTNRKRISARKIETFQFRTKRVPYYVAQQLSNIFASKTVTVDGTEYLRAINITKNNDEGTMWIVNSTLLQECNEINFTCDN